MLRLSSYPGFGVKAKVLPRFLHVKAKFYPGFLCVETKVTLFHISPGFCIEAVRSYPGIMASAYSTAVTVPATLDLEKMVLRK